MLTERAIDRRPASRSGRRRLEACLWLLAAVTAFAAGPASGGEPIALQESDQEPRRYDVDREFVQGIVRDVTEGGRMLLVELRDDHELIRGTDAVVEDSWTALDLESSALRTGDRRDGRLRMVDLEWATGWAFIDDLEGGEPEVVSLDEMYERFRVGQIVEVGAPHGDLTEAVLVESFGGRRGGGPDPRDPRVGATAYQGRVDTLRIEGPVRVRVNRAFE